MSEHEPPIEQELTRERAPDPARIYVVSVGDYNAGVPSR